MALYPNVPFSDGDDWSPDLAYQAFNAPVFDDLPQYLGHRQRILDNELSNTPGQIKDRVSILENSLRLTREGSGLILRYASGQVLLTSGLTTTIASGLLGVPDNTTSVVFVDRQGIPRVDSRFPAICVPLGRVTAVNGAISVIEDYRHPNLRRVQPNPTALQTFGGQSTIDFVGSHQTNLDQGVYYFRDFTIPAGVLQHCNSGTKIYCSGRVTIAGTLNVYPTYNQTPRYAYNLSSAGTVGGQFGMGQGSNGSTYSWAVSEFGSGGSAGVAQSLNTNAWAYTGAGGFGGGSVTIEAAGSISINSGGIIQAFGYDGQEGGSNNVTLAADSWMNRGSIAVSGSGGGSGGLILLKSLTSITASTGSSFNVRGGSGGWGVGYSAVAGERVAAAGGGGGGGGWVVLQSPNNNTSGANINLLGGLSGGMKTVLAHSTPYMTEPVSGTFRAASVPMWLGGGSGGGFAGGHGMMVATQATEGGVGVNYWQRQQGVAGTLLLQSFLPIG